MTGTKLTARGENKPKKTTLFWIKSHFLVVLTSLYFALQTSAFMEVVPFLKKGQRQLNLLFCGCTGKHLPMFKSIFGLPCGCFLEAIRGEKADCFNSCNTNRMGFKKLNMKPQPHVYHFNYMYTITQ